MYGLYEEIDKASSPRTKPWTLTTSPFCSQTFQDPHSRFQPLPKILHRRWSLTLPWQSGKFNHPDAARGEARFVGIGPSLCDGRASSTKRRTRIGKEGEGGRGSCCKNPQTFPPRKLYHRNGFATLPILVGIGRQGASLTSGEPSCINELSAPTFPTDPALEPTRYTMPPNPLLLCWPRRSPLVRDALVHVNPIIPLPATTIRTNSHVQRRSSQERVANLTEREQC